jgi:hypothetical protein
MGVKRSRSSKSSRTSRTARRDVPKPRGVSTGTRPHVGGDVPPETTELLDEVPKTQRGATRTIDLLLADTGATLELESVAAVHEALERLDEARDALVHADQELRIRALHEDASVAFAETLSEVLGTRPLSVEDARRAALAAAASTVWEDAVGPLLTSEQAQALLNISRQRLSQLVGQRRLILLEEQSGARRYPAWQFGPRGRPLATLIAAHRTLVEDGHMSGWSAASWCVHEHPELDRRSPRDWAAGGEDPNRLALVARRDADRAAQ